MGFYVMVWCRAYIQNSRENRSVCNESYADEFLPVTWSLMHDNDPKYTRTLKWLEKKQIRVLEWSTQSPDLNPKFYGRMLRLKSKYPATLDELWHTTEEAWNNIPVKRFEKLAESVPERCGAVLASKGFPMKC
ncbi:hypothetical protein Trydic_g2755 [Trypoxylus dichotomus]